MPEINKQRAPLVHLSNSLAGLSDVASRVGQYILANPEKVVHQTVAELAEFTHSGQASVVRLCRQLGFNGFSDFKLALMAELATTSQQSLADSHHDDSHSNALMQRLVTSMQSTTFALDPAKMRKAAQYMVKARRIDIFGSGVSGIVAQLVAYRLMRLGLPAQAFQDPVLAHEVMTGVDKSCVALVISESGLTMETVEFLKIARSVNAKSIAVTGRVNSPVAKAADLVLLAVPVEPLTYGGDISPAIAKVYLAEMLATYITEALHQK
ncbi:MAG: MurR/RpiR family transcriptional regulator [Alcaligenaceae bacterium]|nr:MurR/RpiR family transcriptional regulator [Alcaligenaceae bacterium]